MSVEDAEDCLRNH